MTAPQTFRPAAVIGQQGSAGTTGRVEEGEASARPTGCDYAWCDKPRVWKADGWLFCGIHFLEHCSLFRGAKWPHKRDLHDPWSKEMDMKPHGTPAALVRHRRAGEMPCIVCRNAAEQRKVDAGQRSANSNWGEERKGAWTA